MPSVATLQTSPETSPAEDESPLRVVTTIARPHIVAIAALGTLTFGWVFFDLHPWTLCAVSALDWFLVNLLNRAVDVSEDAKNRIAGTSWVARHRRAVLVCGFATLFVSLTLIRIAPALTPVRLVFHTLGLAYNWPLSPNIRRVKELYFWKNIASATGFLLTVFAYPLVAFGWRGRVPLAADITWTSIGAAALFFFLFEISYEVLYDLRDVEGDALMGVRTYPVVQGERVARYIAAGLATASALVLVVGYAAGALPWRLFVMVVAPMAQIAFIARSARRPVTAAGCIGITWFGAALLASYDIWGALHLPGAL